MDIVQNIDKKVTALLTLNKHLGKEYYSGEILSMISELKVDLAEIRYSQENEIF